eukprot:gene15857-18843_t
MDSLHLKDGVVQDYVAINIDVEFRYNLDPSTCFIFIIFIMVLLGALYILFRRAIPSVSDLRRLARWVRSRRLSSKQNKAMLSEQKRSAKDSINNVYGVERVIRAMESIDMKPTVRTLTLLLEFYSALGAVYKVQEWEARMVDSDRRKMMDNIEFSPTLLRVYLCLGRVGAALEVIETASIKLSTVNRQMVLEVLVHLLGNESGVERAYTILDRHQSDVAMRLKIISEIIATGHASPLLAAFIDAGWPIMSLLIDGSVPTIKMAQLLYQRGNVSLMKQMLAQVTANQKPLSLGTMFVALKMFYEHGDIEATESAIYNMGLTDVKQRAVARLALLIVYCEVTNDLFMMEHLISCATTRYDIDSITCSIVRHHLLRGLPGYSMALKWVARRAIVLQLPINRQLATAFSAYYAFRANTARDHQSIDHWLTYSVPIEQGSMDSFSTHASRRFLDVLNTELGNDPIIDLRDQGAEHLETLLTSKPPPYQLINALNDYCSQSSGEPVPLGDITMRILRYVESNVDAVQYLALRATLPRHLRAFTYHSRPIIAAIKANLDAGVAWLQAEEPILYQQDLSVWCGLVQGLVSAHLVDLAMDITHTMMQRNLKLTPFATNQLAGALLDTKRHADPIVDQLLTLNHGSLPMESLLHTCLAARLLDAGDTPGAAAIISDQLIHNHTRQTIQFAIQVYSKLGHSHSSIYSYLSKTSPNLRLGFLISFFELLATRGSADQIPSYITRNLDFFRSISPLPQQAVLSIINKLPSAKDKLEFFKLAISPNDTLIHVELLVAIGQANASYPDDFTTQRLLKYAGVYHPTADAQHLQSSLSPSTLEFVLSYFTLKRQE